MNVFMANIYSFSLYNQNVWLELNSEQSLSIISAYKKNPTILSWPIMDSYLIYNMDSYLKGVIIPMTCVHFRVE